MILQGAWAKEEDHVSEDWGKMWFDIGGFIYVFLRIILIVREGLPFSPFHRESMIK